jgi:BMFP domain-containing protein YqiC
MVEPRGRILDDLARLVTDAAGVAQGVRREAETLARAQLDRLISGMDLVSREEFEVVRDMAAIARDENEALEKRIAALEAALAAAGAAPGAGPDPLRS